MASSKWSTPPPEYTPGLRRATAATSTTSSNAASGHANSLATSGGSVNTTAANTSGGSSHIVSAASSINRSRTPLSAVSRSSARQHLQQINMQYRNMARGDSPTSNIGHAAVSESVASTPATFATGLHQPLSSLQSPVKIVSPIKGVSGSSARYSRMALFPPSPVAVEAATASLEEPLPSDHSQPASIAQPTPPLASSTLKKRFDMSDWQTDLAAISTSSAVKPHPFSYTLATTASTTTSRSATPTALHFHNEQHAELKPALNSKRSMSLVATAPQSPRSRHILGSRLPIASTSTAAPPRREAHDQKVAGCAQARAAKAPSSQIETTVQYTPYTTRTHFPAISPRTAALLIASNHHTPPYDDDFLANDASPLASSFDERAKCIRQRHRTMSISESEADGNDADANGHAESDEEFSTVATQSPRYRQRHSRHQSASTSPQNVLRRSAGRGHASGASSKRASVSSLKAKGKAVDLPCDEVATSTSVEMMPDGAEDDGADKSMEGSPFVDTPGRHHSRGKTSPPCLPVSRPSASSTSNVKSTAPSTTLAPFTINPSLTSTFNGLKSSRVSYPPKSLNFDLNGKDKRGNGNALFSSVPASHGSPNTVEAAANASRQVDQLFLASILGQSSATLASTARDDPPAPHSASVSRCGSLSRAHADHTADAHLAAAALSPQAAGRKRTANGRFAPTSLINTCSSTSGTSNSSNASNSGMSSAAMSRNSTNGTSSSSVLSARLPLQGGLLHRSVGPSASAQASVTATVEDKHKSLPVSGSLGSLAADWAATLRTNSALAQEANESFDADITADSDMLIDSDSPLDGKHRRGSASVGHDRETNASSTEDGRSAAVPSLTDSSSAASSLASSRNSRLQQHPIIIADQDMAKETDCDDDIVVEFPDLNAEINHAAMVIHGEAGADASFGSAASSSDFGTISARHPLKPHTGHIRRTSSSARRLFAAGGVEPGAVPSPAKAAAKALHIDTKTAGNASDKTKRSSPQFRNIKPLQAAFVNSGLISKKNRHNRVAHNDSGVGVTPPVWKRFLGGSAMAGTSSANTSFNSTSASNLSLANSSFGQYTPNDIGTPSRRNVSSFFGSPVVTAELQAASPMAISTKAAVGGDSLMPPDTPCKKNIFNPIRRGTVATKDRTRTQTSTSAQHQLHPLAQSSKPINLRTISFASATSDDSSVINSMPGSAVKPIRASPTPYSQSPSPKAIFGNASAETLASSHSVSPTGRPENHSHSGLGAADSSVSPSSNGSPLGSMRGALLSAAGRVTKRVPPVQLQRIGIPALFRRRSSGQLRTGADGAITTDRSGGSIRYGVHDWEPMTPTRAAGGQSMLSVPQLAISPQYSAHSVQSPDYCADAPMVSPTSPLYQQAPSLAQRLTAQDRGQAATAPRAPLAHIKPPQRPVMRMRHSSSVIQTVRQTELASPDRFSTSFELVRIVGQGEFSEAYEVHNRENGQVSAVKKTKVPFGGPKDRLRRLEEVDILRLLSETVPTSPYILQFMDAWEQSGNLFIQTELCTHGNLAIFLEALNATDEALGEARMWKILAELSNGIAHIHRNGVLHLDLKPANIFITASGGLKIGDFGLATRWPRASAITILQGAGLDSPSNDVWPSDKARTKTKSPIRGCSDLEREGDREYIAPEILSGKYGPEADMFSLGMVMLEVAANVVIPDNGLPWRKLRENDLSDVNVGGLSDEFVHIIVQLLESDPSKRTTIEELQAHPVVAKVQDLREKGIRAELGDEAMLSGDIARAMGAVLQEAENFMPDIFAEVRHAWHSPRRHRVSSTPANMDVDEA